MGPKGPWQIRATGPVTKQSRQWPFGVAILAVTQWRTFLAFIHFDKAGVVLANCSGKDM